jgi:cysteine desulfurase/selenocysteine lyase
MNPTDPPRYRRQPGPTGASPSDPRIDVEAVRQHFAFVARGRIVTNNAASTQPPRELLALYRSLAPDYESVHRSASPAARAMGRRLDEAYATVAQFLNAPKPECVVFYRNTTEAINAVMYSLLGELESGDNVVATLMEHNSNYVPWYALCREILPRFGINVECRLARFDQHGKLDLNHLASLIDRRTKLVSVCGASNFFGTKNPLAIVRELARGSGYRQPNGSLGSLFVVDGAQLAPTAAVDVQALDVDFFAFSMHKMLAPFGVGILCAKEELLRSARPFLYGGGMIAEGRVSAEHVEYGDLPHKFSAGTPNLLGSIVSAESLRLLVDLALDPRNPRYFCATMPLAREDVERAMRAIEQHTRALTELAMSRLREIHWLTLYGPQEPSQRTPLVSFNVEGHNPLELAERLGELGVEARAGCHCATLAHRALGLDPPASCRLSFYVYNTIADVEHAVGALREIVMPSQPTRREGRRAHAITLVSADGRRETSQKGDGGANQRNDSPERSGIQRAFSAPRPPLRISW